jgi:hypothetical protein
MWGVFLDRQYSTDLFPSFPAHEKQCSDLKQWWAGQAINSAKLSKWTASIIIKNKSHDRLHRLCYTGGPLPIADCRLPIAYCLLLLVACCLLPIAYCLLPIAYWLLAIGYWLLAIGFRLSPTT